MCNWNFVRRYERLYFQFMWYSLQLQITRLEVNKTPINIYDRRIFFRSQIAIKLNSECSVYKSGGNLLLDEDEKCDKRKTGNNCHLYPAQNGSKFRRLLIHWFSEKRSKNTWIMTELIPKVHETYPQSIFGLVCRKSELLSNTSTLGPNIQIMSELEQFLDGAPVPEWPKIAYLYGETRKLAQFNSFAIKLRLRWRFRFIFNGRQMVVTHSSHISYVFNSSRVESTIPRCLHE